MPVRASASMVEIIGAASRSAFIERRRPSSIAPARCWLWFSPTGAGSLDATAVVDFLDRPGLELQAHPVGGGPGLDFFDIDDLSIETFGKGRYSIRHHFSFSLST